MAPKCQSRSHFTSYKYFHLNYSSWCFSETSAEEMLFFGTARERNKESLEEDKKRLSFLLSVWEGALQAPPSKTRIKGTGEINDVVTEVLSLSLPVIFELYRWIVIRYFSLAELVAVLNACHLVLEDGVTDRAFGEGGKRASGRASWKASRL